MGKCKRCDGCRDMPHHRMDNPDFGNDDDPDELNEFDCVCKHCDAVGNLCQQCDGYGQELDTNFCNSCDGYGVIWKD